MAFSWIGANRWADEVIQNKKDQDEFNKRVRLQREEAILASYIKNSGPAGTGTNKANGAVEKATKLRSRIEDLNITDEGLKGYFDNILSDPYASADIMDFLEDQAKNYDRVIKLQDLPNIINIVNSPASTQEKFDLIKELDVVDLTNKNDYLKLATKVANMTGKEGRTVFIDVPETVVSKADFTTREKQFEGVRKEVVRMATVARDSGHPEAVRIQAELENLGSNESALVDRAEQYLMSMFVTPEFIQGLEDEYPTPYRGLSKNHLVAPYIKTSPSQEPLPEPSEKTYPQPSQQDIDILKQNRNSQQHKDYFDEIYGPGAAEKVLQTVRRR